MKIRHILRNAAVAATVAALAGAALAAPAAATTRTHHHTALGTRSLATVLASDGDKFDHNWYDFDIVDQAVAAVLAAKPGSPVGLLAKGSVPLTAFIPNDRAFQRFAFDLTHHWEHTERGVLNAIVRAAGVNGVEQVLLYHVVPGATITARQALHSDGTVLKTAQGETFRVDVINRWRPLVRLIDKDRNDRDPYLVRYALDINKGNVQIAHGISAVLRPFDL
ncbi:fasciclin domain-containing protein [Xylanimonas sp. McL0601]|uniref:fasciclin domain-containing protein n=1 Tax=Xylanimonas sp. McL0601 TaxID=3414739 RepID=UPI003CF8ED4A